MVVVLLVVLALVTEFILRRTQYGRNLYLVGGNINAADNLGLKSRNYIWSAYIAQGLYAAVGAMVMMTRQFSASGNLALQGPLNVIPMVIVGGTSMAGGKGSLIGAFIGMLIMGVMNNILNSVGVPTFLCDAIKGAIIIFAVMVQKKDNT